MFAELVLETGGEVESEALKGGGRSPFKEEAQVGIAVVALNAAGDGSVRMCGDGVRLGLGSTEAS